MPQNDYQSVTVPGVGDVEFPTSMSNDAISAAIQKNYPQLGKPTASAVPSVQGTVVPGPSTLGTPGPGLPELNKQLGMSELKDLPRAALGPMGPMIGIDPQSAHTKELQDQVLALHPKAAAAIADYKNIAQKSILPALFKGFLAQRGIDDDPVAKMESGLQPNLGGNGTIEAPDSKLVRAAKGAGRGVLHTAEGLTTPENLAMAAGFAVAPESDASRVATGLFSGQALQGAAKETKAAFGPNEDIGERVEHGVGAGTNALFGLLGMTHLLGPHGEAPVETQTQEAQPKAGPVPFAPEDLTPKQVNASDRASYEKFINDPLQPVGGKFGQQEPPTGGPATSDKYADFMGNVAKRLAQESVGQDVLDRMTERKISPIDASKQFWTDTYFKLPEGAQETFRRYLQKETSFKPGDAIGTDAKGAPLVAQDWSDLADKILDLPKDPEHLEGTTRGLVALMQEANDRFGSKQTSQAEAVEPNRQLSPGPKPSDGSPLIAKEAELRPVIGNILRIKQLQEAAKTRLDVQLAVKDAKADLPFDTARLGSVSKALGISEDSLRDQHYQLTDEQLATLGQTLREGKKAMPLPEDHPEHPFAPNGIRPLSEVNENSLRAAGLPNPKDRFALLSEKEKADYQVAYGRSNADKTSKEAAEAESERETPVGTKSGPLTTLGEREARISKAVASGKSADQLDYEHGLVQKILERRLRQSRDSLKSLTYDWRDLRRDASEPSELSQQVAALSGYQRLSLPRELYAPEHLSPKTGESAESSVLQKPIPTSETPTVVKAPEGSIAAERPQGKAAKSSKQQVIDMALDIEEKHGDKTSGSMPMIADAVMSKYKSPGNVNAMLLSVMREYKNNLDTGVEDPLTKALQLVDKAPEETGQSGRVSANPVDVIWQKLFGSREKALLPQSIRRPIEMQNQPISKLTDSLKEGESPTAAERAKAYMDNESQRLIETARHAPTFTKEFFDKFKDGLGKAWQAFKERPGLDSLQWALGFRRLDLTANSIVMHEFHDEILRLHPSDVRREAMVNYLQAGGGVLPDHIVNAQLAFKADQFADRADLKRLKKGYADAQDLSDPEKATIAKYRQYDKFLTDQETEKGLDLQRRENYIRQVWSKDSFAKKQIDAVFSAAPFSINPNWMKMRKYEDYFEGEMAGLTPHRKDFAYLVSSRARSSAEVLANRRFVDHLYENTTPNGDKLAKVSGIGFSQHADPTAEESKGAVILVKPVKPADAVTSDGRPYVTFNHPAFQNYKWVASTDRSLGDDGQPVKGTPIMYKGNMLVHPDIAKQLDRVLGASKLRESAVLSGLLKASSIGKQTLLIGLFHPVQLAVHALEHAAEGGTTGRAMKALNPFSKSNIDLTQNVQKMLVIHGLKIADYNAEGMWDEGVMSRGFANAAPFMGGFLRTLHDAMFTKYIPNLKMSMALDALNRNMGRYHDTYVRNELKGAGLEAKSDQAGYKAASLKAQSRIYRMTAEQMNSAFGGINWDALPVGKTGQDVARLMVLAPDFLLARMQFVGDALRPGGMESRKALLIGAFVQYLGARAFNSAMNDGDPKWNIQDWNKFIVGRHQYSLRTVQGDLADSVMDPKRFWMYRMNPITERPFIEAWNDRDVFGHPASAGVQLMDFAKNIVPIPLQGAANKLENKFNPSYQMSRHDESIADTIIQSLGLQARTYRSPAEKKVFEDFDDTHAIPQHMDDWSLEQKTTFNHLRDEFRNGKLDPNEMQKALASGALKPTEVKYLFQTKHQTELVTRAKFLTAEQVKQAWQVATPKERLELSPVLVSKIKTLPTADRMKTSQMVQSYLGNLSKDQLTQYHNQVQQDIEWEQGPPPGVSQ